MKISVKRYGYAEIGGDDHISVPFEFDSDLATKNLVTTSEGGGAKVSLSGPNICPASFDSIQLKTSDSELLGSITKIDGGIQLPAIDSHKVELKNFYLDFGEGTLG